MPNNDYIKRSDAFKWVCGRCSAAGECENLADPCFVEVSINMIPAADVEPVRKDAKLYTAHEVAVILAEMIGDDCACNVNDNIEWLPEYCEFSETVCPDVCGVGCWEQYLMAREKRKTGEGRRT